MEYFNQAWPILAKTCRHGNNQKKNGAAFGSWEGGLQAGKALHALLLTCDVNAGRDLLILGRWRDNSSGQMLAELTPRLQTSYTLQFSVQHTESQTSGPNLFFCSWWPQCNLSVSISHCPCNSQGHQTPPDFSSARAKRVQTCRGTSKPRRVPISPPDDRRVQGDTQCVRRSVQVMKLSE